MKVFFKNASWGLTAAVLLVSCYSLSNRTRQVVEANCHCKNVQSEYNDSVMTITLGSCNVKDAEAEAQMLMDTLASQLPAVCESKRVLTFKFIQPDGKALTFDYSNCERRLKKVD